MKSAIEKLYYMHIDTAELSKEQLKCLEIAAACDEKLTELFRENAEALDAYRRFKDAVDENYSYETLACYKVGFRNGFQIALDAFLNSDDSKT